MYSTNQNQQILDAIGELSQQQIQIVLQFIQTLQPKRNSNPTSAPYDPLTNFIGASNYGVLANKLTKISMINAIFIDTWGWLTLNDSGERRHKEVANLYQTLIAERTPILYQHIRSR